MARVDADTLAGFARELVRGMGGDEQTARQVAASLVAADRCGHTSHGVLRLPWYAEMVDDGRLDPAGTPVVGERSGATASVDGRYAFGQVVGRTAVDTAVEIADAEGAAAVGLRDATHLGRIGEWAERAAAEGMVFAAFVNTGGGAPLVALPGSTERRMSTNPIAVGVPTLRALPFDIVLDMATSQVAHGKIRELAATGDPIPEGWALDEQGEPMDDALAFEEGAGAQLPLGGRTSGYKGFGLGAVAELIAGCIGGGLVAGQGDPAWANNAAAFLAIDHTRFLSREAIEERVAAFADHVRDTTPSPELDAGVAASGDEALLPGEAEHRIAGERRETGIPIPDEIAGRLVDLAERSGVSDAVPDDFRD